VGLLPKPRRPMELSLERTPAPLPVRSHHSIIWKGAILIEDTMRETSNTRDPMKERIVKLATMATSCCLLLAFWYAAVRPVLAQQQAISVSNSSVQPDYPNSLTFSCSVKSPSNITDIRLDYQVQQVSFAQVTAEAKVDFTPSNSVNAAYKLNMQQSGQIPPGTDITYRWVVEDAAGDKTQSTKYDYVVVDNRHTWSALTQGKIHLLWYGQNASFGDAVMKEAQTALSTLATDTGATPDQVVNISVYTSPQDYAASVAGAPEWAGGEELSEYDAVFIMARPASLSTDLRGVAHELTHVIVGQIIANPYNSIPFWLNEGLAVHIQFAGTTLPSQFTNALSSALANGSLISVRTLSDPFSAYADKATLSYAESVSVVNYLLSQYGSQKMLALLDTFQQGSTYDGALQSTYGFDMDGLYSQWKAWASRGNT